MSDKPVAYRYWNEHNKCFFFCDSPEPVDGSIYEPLYTHPQPRKPLTTEQCRAIILEAGTIGKAIAMVEAAHGIKE